MDEADIIARADANYFATMTTFVGNAERGEVREKGAFSPATQGRTSPRSTLASSSAP